MIREYIECDHCRTEFDIDLEDYIEDNIDDVLDFIGNPNNNNSLLWEELFPLKTNIDDLKVRELSILYKNLSLSELQELTSTDYNH